jgi:hypothetical protein
VRLFQKRVASLACAARPAAERTRAAWPGGAARPLILTMPDSTVGCKSCVQMSWGPVEGPTQPQLIAVESDRSQKSV